MKELLLQLLRGTPLTAAQTESVFTDIMDGGTDPAQSAALLTLLAVREPTVDELAGAATVMRRHAVAIDAPEILPFGAKGAASVGQGPPAEPVRPKVRSHRVPQRSPPSLA